MGVFINPDSTPFKNLSNTPQTLLVADVHPIEIESILVTNLNERQPININLQIIRSYGTTDDPLEMPTTIELSIPSLQTVDVLNGKGMRLTYSVTPPISDSVIIFSKGVTQVYNCVVNSLLLNELPF